MRICRVVNYFQYLNCEVFARQDAVTGSTGANVYKFADARVYNGNGTLEDWDDSSGCNLTPITGYNNQWTFFPRGGIPYTAFLFAGNAYCNGREEADLTWNSAGT